MVKIEKPSGAQVWAGASLNLEAKVDFTKGTKVKVKVWSPKSGAKILYKMEVSTSPKDGNGNPTVFVEVEATTSVTNAWQELTFDLTSSPAFNTANEYDRVILLPDFGVNGTGTNLKSNTTEKLMILNHKNSNQKKRNIFCPVVLFFAGVFSDLFFVVVFFAILYQIC